MLGRLPEQGLDFGHNRSVSSIGNGKADKMLGLEMDRHLFSLYMRSGPTRHDPSRWVPADADATALIQCKHESLGFYWRPEMLGAMFLGKPQEKFVQLYESSKRVSKDYVHRLTRPPSLDKQSLPQVPDIGPEGLVKLLTQTLKAAHPLECCQQLDAPARHDALLLVLPPSNTPSAIAARKRLEANGSLTHRQLSVVSLDETAELPSAKQQADLARQAEIAFRGVTLVMWLPVEGSARKQLVQMRAQLNKRNALDSVLRAPVVAPADSHGKGFSLRGAIPWSVRSRNASMSEVGDTEAETATIGSNKSRKRKDGKGGKEQLSVPLGPFDNMSGATSSASASGMDTSRESSGPFAEHSDTFWVPHAVTLVSRHPVYNIMTDFLRVEFDKCFRDSVRHVYTMCKALTYPAPRPGEQLSVRLGTLEDPPIVQIKATFPGAVDFDKGMIQPDFDLWPLFNAVDVDIVLTCIEIALSTSGRVVFTSSHPMFLSLCVNALKYIVDLRGWSGIMLPIIHARDVSFIMEDPGPYIVGLPNECRYAVPIPAEVCIVDLDNNDLSLKKPPANVVTPRGRREKVKHKIFQALGPGYPMDRNVPRELMMAFYNGRLHTMHREVTPLGPSKTPYSPLKRPEWWDAPKVLGVLDKIMSDKHKKPSLINRLTKTGLTRYHAQMTVGEQLAKTMMRRRALHYVETRDDLEGKVARVNQRLMQLLQEGQKFKRQFDSFERQADLLAQETLKLQAQMESEKREAARLSKLGMAQAKSNKELEDRLRATEAAQAEAMRHLSDMQESIHDLEREREEIMNVIEAQINNAMDYVITSPSMSVLTLDEEEGEHGPVDGESKGAASSKTHTRGRGRRVRPGTGGSGASFATAMTGHTATTTNTAFTGRAAPSIRGRGYGTAGRSGTDKATKRMSTQTSGTIERIEVAARVAAIQAKLDLALKAARGEEVELGDFEEETETLSESGGTVCGDQTGVTVDGEANGISTAPEPTPTTQDDKVPLTEPGRPPRSAARPATAQELGLIRPGKQLRIRTKADGERSVSASTTASMGSVAPDADAAAGDGASDAAAVAVAATGLGLSVSTDTDTEPATPTPTRSSAPLPPARSSSLVDSLGFDNDEDKTGMGLGHDKGLTHSSSVSTQGEILVSPPSSPILIRGDGNDVEEGGEEMKGWSRRDMGRAATGYVDGKGVGKNGDGMGGEGEEDEDEEMRRMSRVSTGTVAFGPI